LIVAATTASWDIPALAAVAQTIAVTSGATLRPAAVIDLPGPPGKRFDYLTIADDDRWLLAAHLGAGLLYIIDLNTNRLVKAIANLPGIEGIAYVPETRKVYTSNWYENTIGVVDLQAMKVVNRLPTESKPDGIAYAPPFHKLYVSDERGAIGLVQFPGHRSGAEAVVDLRSDSIVKTLHFDSETGVPQYDPVARRVYVNLQDLNAVAAIDPTTDTVVGKYPVEGCESNHGMALDPAHRRAFLSCEGNDMLTVFDLDGHRAIAHLPMAAGADVVAFDAGLGRVYVACSSGAISVFQEDDPDHFRKLEDYPVEAGIHSLAVDPRTHRLYAPEEQEKGKAVARLRIFGAVVPRG
jgi:DNA-binding beta-propeller fold protein YncE